MCEIDKNRQAARLRMPLRSRGRMGWRQGAVRIDGSIAKSTKTISARIFVGKLGSAVCPAVSDVRTIRTKCCGKKPG